MKGKIQGTPFFVKHVTSAAIIFFNGFLLWYVVGVTLVCEYNRQTCCIIWCCIKCLVAVAGDSARLVSSVHLHKEVLGVMDVQSEQQENHHPRCCRHCHGHHQYEHEL